MNAAELARMTRIDGHRISRPCKRQAAELAGRTGQPVFVTLAEHGIVGALPGQRPEHVPALPGPRPDRHRRRRRRRHRQPGGRPGRRGRPPRGHGARHGRRLARDPPARDDRDGLGCPDRRVARNGMSGQSSCDWRDLVQGRTGLGPAHDRRRPHCHRFFTLAFRSTDWTGGRMIKPSPKSSPEAAESFAGSSRTRGANSKVMTPKDRVQYGKRLSRPAARLFGRYSGGMSIILLI